ncbi:MAG: energy transducer TonB [Myxococcota bacterium]
MLALLLVGPLAAAEEVLVGGVDAMEIGPTVDERLAEIRRRIQAAVSYPRLARSRGLEGVTTVGFEIDRTDGLAKSVQLVDSSGHASLDRAAERSVVRAGQLPWVYGRLRVPVRFDLEQP